MTLTAYQHMTLLIAGALLLAGLFLRAEDAAVRLDTANPLQGMQAITSKGCITCHSIWGVGGKIGPDLAATGADQSFQQLASMFWNHTPRMVQLLKQKGREWPILTEKEMADIISFIYYLKLLDRPGSAELGKQVFQGKHCDSCHSLRDGALPLVRFGAYVAPVNLSQAMWNAGRTMRETQRARGIAMPLFHGREMADLQAYIRSEVTSSVAETAYLPLPDLARGASLFRSKGCASCHQSGGGKSIGPDLSKQQLRKSMSEICGLIWNHSFAMQATIAARGMAFPRLENSELADILAYVYFLHFSRDEGDAARGENLFVSKGCITCHGPNKQGPNLLEGGERFEMLRLATSMWNHAPIMYQSMENEVMKWIQLDPNDMQDLSKYLRRARKGP
ncbi:MAG: c-type cytochrome [Acidobacteriota bacterium]